MVLEATTCSIELALKMQMRPRRVAHESNGDVTGKKRALNSSNLAHCTLSEQVAVQQAASNPEVLRWRGYDVAH